ncbi:LbtU family siderophore porin [Stieleria sp. JC731]|nr:LbtU family siderophore porin [Stieleria sp. JC731]MCC9599112.1 LbtU family siderophore porin [Stieleria sp. JC731]
MRQRTGWTLLALCVALLIEVSTALDVSAFDSLPGYESFEEVPLGPTSDPDGDIDSALDGDPQGGPVVPFEPAAEPWSVVQQEIAYDAHTVGHPGYSLPYNHRAGSRFQPSFIQLDTELFGDLLDFQNHQTEKQLLLRDENASWSGKPVVLVGSQARLSILAATTNRDDKFSYLGRFPADFTGSSATDARLLQANLGMATYVNPWISGYGELLFSDVFTFPDFKQGSLQVRQAYAVFGDPAQSPWYAFIGKKNVSFGDMGTLLPFSQSVVWHYFAALHEGVGVGYQDENLSATLTGINGGRGIRLADSEAKGKINNFAANMIISGGQRQLSWRLGAGFLYGTIYDGLVAEHLDTGLFGEANHAWDVNAELKVRDFTFQGEFVSTTGDWPVTSYPVSAYRAEAAYDSLCYGRPARYAISWSDGHQAESGSEFEFNQQFAVGMGLSMGPHATCSVEYVRSLGFAPLINITTVSDRDVVQDSLVLGMTIVL